VSIHKYRILEIVSYSARISVKTQHLHRRQSINKCFYLSQCFILGGITTFAFSFGVQVTVRLIGLEPVGN